MESRMKRQDWGHSDLDSSRHSLAGVCPTAPSPSPPAQVFPIPVWGPSRPRPDHRLQTSRTDRSKGLVAGRFLRRIRTSDLASLFLPSQFTFLSARHTGINIAPSA